MSNESQSKHESLTATEYLGELFEPSDTVAVLVRNREPSPVRRLTPDLPDEEITWIDQNLAVSQSTEEAVLYDGPWSVTWGNPSGPPPARSITEACVATTDALPVLHPSPENSRQGYEVIDSVELAKRWSVPESWVREQTRSRAADPLPHVRLGRYVRFEWGSPKLASWWERRRS